MYIYKGENHHFTFQVLLTTLTFMYLSFLQCHMMQKMRDQMAKQTSLLNSGWSKTVGGA